MLPNILTIARLFLTVGFLYCLTSGGVVSVVFAIILFTAASLTDYFDGYYAKKYNMITNFGKIMDPIADKFLLLGAFFVFLRMDIMPFWMFAIIAAREIIITGCRFYAMKKGVVMAAEKAGKLKTVMQITTVSFILILLFLQAVYFSPGEMFWKILFWVIYLLMGATVAVTFVSGVMALWNNRKVFSS